MEDKSEKLIEITGRASNWQEAIELSSKALFDQGYVKEDFGQACITREKEYPTGLPVPIGVAIPHADSIYVNKMGICFLRLENHVPFRSMENFDDWIDCKLIFNLAVKDPNEQVVYLSKLMKAISNEEFINKCLTLPLEETHSLIQKAILD